MQTVQVKFVVQDLKHFFFTSGYFVLALHTFIRLTMSESQKLCQFCCQSSLRDSRLPQFTL